MIRLTDCCEVLKDFTAIHVKTIPRRTVLPVLGDARNNHDDPAAGVLRRIRERAQRIGWLKPGPPALCHTGDPVMGGHRPYCDGLLQCCSTRHLEELVPDLTLQLKEVQLCRTTGLSRR